MNLRKKFYEYVVLRKDKPYVLCHLKKRIILEEECDNYEYNEQCDKTHQIIKRTHRKGSLSGAVAIGPGRGPRGSLINECDYCTKDPNLITLAIPLDAQKYFPRKEGDKNDTFRLE